MARAVTIRAVARQAGVGIATVSRVLNGAPGVAPDTAAKVRRAMAALNYQPSAAGRSLRSGASRALGVMVPTISNPIFALSLEGLEAVARERGFSTIIASSHYDPGKEETVVGDLKARGVEGMVLTLCSPSPAALEMVEAQGVPYVLLFNVLPPSAAPPAFVTVDNRGAVRDACAQLIADGHRRIAFLGGAFASSDRAAERYRGYCDAMEAAHLPVWPATEVPFLSDTP
ncbi:MAG: LacI family DNA-binding transcriptional regulator, partial [Pseudomonadota bacterium]